jgi:hypothetical protein
VRLRWPSNWPRRVSSARRGLRHPIVEAQSIGGLNRKSRTLPIQIEALARKARDVGYLMSGYWDCPNRCHRLRAPGGEAPRGNLQVADLPRRLRMKATLRRSTALL